MTTMKMETDSKYSQPNLVVKKANTALTTAPIWVGRNIPNSTNNKTMAEEMYKTARLFEPVEFVISKQPLSLYSLKNLH
jgi:hypothetical protein